MLKVYFDPYSVTSHAHQVTLHLHRWYPGNHPSRPIVVVTPTCQTSVWDLGAKYLCIPSHLYILRIAVLLA